MGGNLRRGYDSRAAVAPSRAAPQAAPQVRQRPVCWDHRMPAARPAETAATDRPDAGSTDSDGASASSGSTDLVEVSTRAPAPGPERAQRLRSAVRRVAIASGELILIVAALVILGYVFGKLWVILLPVVLGLLFTTVMWPATRFLRKHSWPPALAAATVLLLFLGAFGGILAVIVPQVVSQVEEVADGVTQGLQQVQEWVAGPPFNLDDDQIGNAVDSVINTVQNNAQNIAGYAVTTATTIGNLLINLVLALVLTFFFLKDGTHLGPSLAAQTGPRAAPHIAALSQKTWTTMSEYIRPPA